MTAPMSRAEILALPPAIDLVTLGRALGLSEPTIREQARSGRLNELGIRVVRLGARWLVITESVWRFLGIDPAADRANGEAAPRRPAGRRQATASALRSVIPGGRDAAG